MTFRQKAARIRFTQTATLRNPLGDKSLRDWVSQFEPLRAIREYCCEGRNVKSEADSAKPRRDQGTTGDGKAAAEKTSVNERANERGEFLLR